MSEPVHVAIVFLERDGRFLVQRRRRAPAAGAWEFPGGKVKPNESAAEAAAREAREETGLSVTVLRRVLTTEHDYGPAGPAVRIEAFHAVAPGDEAPSAPDTKWVPRADIPALSMPAANAAFMAWFRAA